MAWSKIFFCKILIFSINNKEIIQISKSKPKKISILCTFKASQKNTGISGRCKICEKLSVHFRIDSVKINYIFGYVSFQNLNKTRSKMNIGGSLHCTAAVVPIIPIISLCNFSPFNSCWFWKLHPPASCDDSRAGHSLFTPNMLHSMTRTLSALLHAQKVHSPTPSPTTPPPPPSTTIDYSTYVEREEKAHPKMFVLD